ncbi:P-loop containing nucleoside triphosphate hydrolase protein [Poronia punctata]|nr:P-loop containing nucleoside triphosphate hydrolase protein [Poronia punctata]
MEDHTTRKTGLKPPTTRIPFTSSTQSSIAGLHEMSDSQHNARVQYAAPVSSSGTKRNAPAPAIVSDPKRKAFQGGASFHGRPATASTTGTKAVGASLKDLNGPLRLPSTNIAAPRHTSTVASNSSFTSNSSYTNSLGYGSRPPSRSHTRTRSATRPARPATSMGTREEPQGNVASTTDIDERVVRMDSELQKVREFMESTEKTNASVKEELDLAKKSALALEAEAIELRSERLRLKDKLEDAERVTRRLQLDLEEERRQFDRQNRILEDDHKREMERMTSEFSLEKQKLAKLQQEFEDRCGAEAEARLERLSQENKELRSTLERQRRDHEHEIRLLQEDIQRRDADLRGMKEELRTASNHRFELETQIRGHVETIDRLRKRAEDAEERLSKDKGHLGGQISLLSSTIDLKSERIQTLEENAKKLQAECELEVQNIKAAAERKIADETAVLREKLVKEEERRHRLFEQLQELKGNIRVMCRIKPPSESEREALIPFKPQMNEIDEDKIDGLIIPTVREDPTEPGKMLPGKPRDFSFERVFDEKCTNRDVFDEISQLVQSVMDGKKVCIFCYGQTGSGKTFTMSKRQGDDDDGVIPRTQSMIFSEVDRLKALGWEYTVEGSYLEVYQDKLYDLLASRNSKPEPLTVDPLGEELKIKGHDFTLLNDARDLDQMVKTADNNRHVAATVKNDRSSRSHSILVLKITGVKKNAEGEIIKTRKGTLNLIDLAGSEKPDKNGPPQVYKEGVEINSSLSYLRTVLASLGQGKTEGVDFRSYTLTQLLRPSLGKGCRTLMFVMVSPLKENENETIRSLEFAKDAQKVKMGGNSSKPKR